MKRHCIVATLVAAALVGSISTLAAQDNAEITSSNSNTLGQNVSEQKPLVKISAPATATQALAQSADKLLSEMKVYPSF